jgi:hypothetical protein
MSTLSPTQQHVLTLLAGGSSVTAAAKATGVHRNTIGNWRRACPEFQQAFAVASEEQEQLWREEVNSLGGLAISTIRDILECGPFSSAMNGPAAGVCMRTAIAVIDRIHKSAAKEQTSAQPSPQLQKDQSAEPVQLAAEPIEQQPTPAPSHAHTSAATNPEDLPTPVCAQSGEPSKSDQSCTTFLYRADRKAAAERARSDAFDAAQAKEQASIGALGAKAAGAFWD